MADINGRVHESHKEFRTIGSTVAVLWVGSTALLSGIETWLILASAEEAERGVAGYGWICLLCSPIWLGAVVSSIVAVIAIRNRVVQAICILLLLGSIAVPGWLLYAFWNNQL